MRWTVCTVCEHTTNAAIIQLLGSEGFLSLAESHTAASANADAALSPTTTSYSIPSISSDAFIQLPIVRLFGSLLISASF